MAAGGDICSAGSNEEVMPLISSTANGMVVTVELVGWSLLFKSFLPSATGALLVGGCNAACKFLVGIGKCCGFITPFQ